MMAREMRAQVRSGVVGKGRREEAYSSLFSIYSAQGGLPQDPGCAAELGAEVRTYQFAEGMVLPYAQSPERS